MKRAALAAWLRTEKRLSKGDAEKWAAQLQGLDQKYLSPLVDIAVDSGTPPLHVLAVLAEKHRVHVLSFVGSDEEQDMLASVRPVCESVRGIRRIPDFRPHWLSVTPFIDRKSVV